MVVGVEPLGHFHGGEGVSVLLCASRHRKIKVDIGWVFELFKTPGDGTNHTGGVQDMIVKRKIVGGDNVNTRRLLKFPMRQPQFLAGLHEVCRADFFRPVIFQCPLQLALRA